MSEKSHYIKHAQDRTEEFLPNPKLIERIGQLMERLAPIQDKDNAQFKAPRLPVVVIVGCPRSGTTILSQILTASGDFAYPTNFLSRFAYAPMLGGMIQQIAFDPDYDYHGELSDIQSTSGFSSVLGKTSGAMAISEFFHFWRRFFPDHDPGYLTPDQLAQVDVARMRAELASIESVFGKPFMSKGMMMQYNIDFFAKHMPELLFVHIKREPRYVLQSVMTSRRKYYGTDKIWWSVKPREYPMLAEMDPAHQVAGQVLYTVKSIDEGLSSVEDNQKIVYDYEKLCADPRGFYNVLRSRFEQRGCTLADYTLDESFRCANNVTMPESELAELEKAYEELQSDSSKVNHEHD